MGTDSPMAPRGRSPKRDNNSPGKLLRGGDGAGKNQRSGFSRELFFAANLRGRIEHDRIAHPIAVAACGRPKHQGALDTRRRHVQGRRWLDPARGSWFHKPLAAVVILDLRLNRRKAATVEIAPEKAVIAATQSRRFVEQGTDMAARPAAVRTIATGFSVRPARVQPGNVGIRRRVRRARQLDREHEGPVIREHQPNQAQRMGQQADTSGPVPPESPVTEKVPGHQRRGQKATN